MMDGDFFIGAALGTTLAKLALRYMSLTSDSKKQNRFCSEAMLIMASILHLGRSGKFMLDWAVKPIICSHGSDAGIYPHLGGRVGAMWSTLNNYLTW